MPLDWWTTRLMLSCLDLTSVARQIRYQPPLRPCFCVLQTVFATLNVERLTGISLQVHLILQHQSPSGEIEEKHLKTPPMVPLDSDTHVFTAILQSSDNT